MKWIFIAMLALCGCGQDNSAPSILFIGDSIKGGYLPYVQLDHPEAKNNGECDLFEDGTAHFRNDGDSRRLAACLPRYLEGTSYGTVYFNAGLHDVFMPGCDSGETAHQVELTDYLSNIQSAIDQIREAGATPVFITTTPVQGLVNCHSNADIIAYNSAAKTMLHNQGVAVLDIYSVVYPVQDMYHRGSASEKNIHFTPEGYAFIAAAIDTYMDK